MNMIEKVARAIDRDAWSHFDAYCKLKQYSPEEIRTRMQESSHLQKSLTNARAAIEAMREPTQEMVDVGYREIDDCIDFYNYDSDCGYDLGAFAPTSTWQAMIDAALKGPSA